MNNREAVNWLINITADIGKAEHSDLWHYEQALTEIKDMLESAQPSEWIKVPRCEGDTQPEPERTMEEFMYGQDMGNPEDGSL